MTESNEPTVATKRAWLSENGYTVGTRGKLSAAQEEAYASQTPAAEATTED